MGTLDSEHTVIVDAMGGDHGHSACVEGALQALRESTRPLRVILVGDEPLIRESLQEFEHNGEAIEVRHATDVIGMTEPASEGMRRRESSIRVAMRLLKDGVGGAVISTGNTGAVMAAGLVDLGRLEGISRPAIASRFPTDGGETLLLDVGANPVCKVQNFVEFAIMGSVFAEGITGKSRPRVALLSIGEEPSKGTELTVAAHRCLSEMSLNFIGNIEGRDILCGRAEVIVCDGFVGNIMLKFAESMSGYLENAVRRQISTNYFSRVGALLMGPFLRRMRNTFDYAEYGGAPLLGLDGLCIICHGSSSPKAIKKAIWAAATVAEHHVRDCMVEALAEYRRTSDEKSEHNRSNQECRQP